MPDSSPNSDFRYFHYDPSLAAAVIFVILFAVSTVWHILQLFRTRTWIMVPFVIGGIFEVVGYAARGVSCKQSPNWTLTPYIIDTVLVLVAPALFAASIYMELGRIILVTDGERRSIIRQKWLTKIFVMGDILSFLMQAGGGGLMAEKKSSSIRTGQHIVVGGLVVQILFFGFFVAVGAVFNIRINRRPTGRSESPEIPWKRHMWALYGASILILVRSIFRVVEYQQGNDGYLLSHEVFLYIFDAVLMLGVMVLLNFIHPSEIYSILRRLKTSQPGSELSPVTNFRGEVRPSEFEYGTSAYPK